MNTYNHRQFVKEYAESLGLDSYATTGWNDIRNIATILRNSRLPILISDFNETSQLLNNDTDSLLERSQYAILCFTQAEVGNPDSVPEARKQARDILNTIIRTILSKAGSAQDGLTYLDRSSFVISPLGFTADWAFGIMLSYEVLTPFLY